MRHLRTADSRSDLLAATAAERIDLLQTAIERVIRGKPEAVRLAIVTLLAGGHLLVEDVPGVGKTTLAHALAREIDDAIAGFVRGQTAVCLILGSFYAVALTIAGLNFGLLIGLLSGLISFVPYVGSMTGLVLATAVAIAQFWPEYTPVVAVVAIFLVGQFIEGYVLAPKLVGESVGLHPVWLMFALFAFGYLFGFVGLLLAVPLAAIVGVVTRFAVRSYLASPLYTGQPAPPPAGIAPPPPRELR